MTLPAFGPGPGPFRALRRGVPLLVGVAAFLTAALHGPGRGWWMLLGTAALASLWPGRVPAAGRASGVSRQDVLWARALRPLARRLGLEEAWILSFCAHNNQRVAAAFQARRARRALILLPHCIQMARCKAPVLEDLQACHDCGLCVVGDYHRAVLLNRWEGRITNRSHKAYREAREYRPDLLVAVSCPDRLLKGIARLPELPSFVLPLALPHGMCVDTTFDLAHLEAAMGALVEPRRPGGDVQPLRRPEVA